MITKIKWLDIEVGIIDLTKAYFRSYHNGRALFHIFRLSSKARHYLLKWVRNDVKFPDGYVAYLASCPDINSGKFT